MTGGAPGMYLFGLEGNAICSTIFMIVNMLISDNFIFGAYNAKYQIGLNLLNLFIPIFTKFNATKIICRGNFASYFYVNVIIYI